MARLIGNIVGIGLVVSALFYFIRPGIWGTHLTGTHALIHLFAGVIAVGAGVWGRGWVRATSLTLGALFLALGIGGFLVGDWGMPSPGVPGPGNSRMWIISAGSLELGLRDHIVHVVVGALLLAGAMLPDRRTDTGEREDTH